MVLWDEFKDFRPSFALLPALRIKDLFKEAWTEARGLIEARLAASEDPNGEFEVEGVLDKSNDASGHDVHWGHFPEAGGNASPYGVLSERLPYKFAVRFREGKVDWAELFLYLLNPRFILSRDGFSPATYSGANRTVTKVPGATAVCGLQLVADPLIAPDERFTRLASGLPAAATAATPGGFASYDRETLVSRLDLSMSWLRDDATQWVDDNFGQAVGVPGGGLPSNVAGHEISFYNPDSAVKFDAMVHDSWWFAVTLESPGQSSGIDLILKPPKKPAVGAPPAEVRRWELHRLLRQEFGLGETFSGIVFRGLSAHLLGDDRKGHSNLTVRAGATAIGFGGSTEAEGSSWYTSLELEWESDPDETFLGFLEARGRIQVSIAKGGARHATLQGRFAQLTGAAFEWLSGKDATVSLVRSTWKDSADVDKEDYGIELAVVGDGDRILKRILPKDVIGGQAAFSTAVTGLLFGPIVTRFDKLDPDRTVAASDAKSRGYFVELGNEQVLGQLLGAASFTALFRDAVEVEELRVTGVYVRNQSAAITNKGAQSDERVTALLFDYEADYHVKVEDAGVETTRSVSTRVDGSGFRLAGQGDRFKWVQVPSGIFSLSLNDPGLWEVTGLGKFLRIFEITIRKREYAELVIRFRFAQNFGFIKADDFVVIIPLADEHASIEAYPSVVEIDIPGALKAKGFLYIQDSAIAGEKNIKGSLDVTLVPTNLRLYAAAQIDKVYTPEGGLVPALVASASVTFPTPITLGASGLALHQLDALYATHFRRDERVVDGIPPALEWLKRADGNVVTSVVKDGLWKPQYDCWAFGLGGTLGLVASPRLINLNGMLVVELPGPTINLFAKLNFLEDPKGNQDAVAELFDGVLGLLQIDVKKKEMTFAAMADLEFRQLVKIHAVMELFFALENLSRWHSYYGTSTAPITAKIEMGDVVNIAAEAYLMIAGDEISLKDGTRLPGFALAFGLHAYAVFGGGDLYCRVDLRARLNVSISERLFMEGTVSLSGELNLWIVSIGASGSIALQFLADPDAGTQVSGSGSICGSVKVWFVRIEGCVSLSFGQAIVHVPGLPDLVLEVGLVVGIDVALFGQGADRRTDAKLGVATKLGVVSAAGVLLPIDGSIVISLSAGPANIGAAGTMLGALGAAVLNTRFNLGGVAGEYRLQDIRLQIDGQGPSILTDSTPARWWRNPTPHSGRQPSPLQLALFTRNPFGTSSSMPSSDVLKAWIDAIAEDPCRDARPPQECMYFFRTRDLGRGADGDWTLPGTLCSLEMENEIGRTGVSNLDVRAKQSAMILPDLAGWPIAFASCVAELGSDGSAHVLSLRRPPPPSAGYEQVRARFVCDEGFSARTPLRMIVAVPPRTHVDEQCGFVVHRRSGASHVVRPIERDLTDRAVREAFHGNCDEWSVVTESFGTLANEMRLRGYAFLRLDFDLSGFTDVHDPAIGLELLWRRAEVEDLTFRILVGAVKFTPLAEEARARAQEARKQRLREEITELFRDVEIPLLEPSTDYVLSIDYVEAGPATTNRTEQYKFRTAEHPPRRLDAYVLATFPTSREQFHFFEDPVGLVLASKDILRILAKYDARLRVTITNETSEKVTDESQAIDWSRGLVIDPAQLIDPKADPPPGLKIDAVASLPSAIRQVLREKIERGELDCLGDLQLPNSALWIEFDFERKPLTGYVVRIDVLHANGAPWAWPADASADTVVDTTQPFFQYELHTSLYDSSRTYAGALRRARIRRRLLQRDLILPAGADEGDQGLTTVDEKALEDALATASGERSNRSGEPQVTLLFREAGDSIAASALILESNEPLIRNAKLPLVRPLDGSASELALTEATWVRACAARPAQSRGIARAVLSSTGFTLLLLFSEDVGDDEVRIELEDLPLERIPRQLSRTTAITIEKELLAPRGKDAV